MGEVMMIMVNDDGWMIEVMMIMVNDDGWMVEVMMIKVSLIMVGWLR